MTDSKARVRGADGLRAIACLLVVWHHITQRLNPDQLPTWLKDIHFFGMRGEVGVSLFFVLSGCLLSLPFWEAFLNSAPMPRLRDYAVHRAARIVPAYWFNLIFCTYFALWVFHLHINWNRLLSGLFFINSYHYTTFFPAELNGPLWSIGLEVSCYVLLPIVLFTVFKTSRKFIPAALFMIVWIGLLQFINPWIIRTFMTDDELKGWQYGLTGGAKQWLPYWNVDTFFTQFLLGSLAALCIAWFRATNRKSGYFFDLLSIASLGAAIYVVAKRLDPGTPDNFTHQPYVAPIYAFFMAVALASASNGLLLWKVLDNRFFKYLAKISFSIYLWHMVIITYIERKVATDYVFYGIHSVSRWLQFSGIVIVIAFLIASISWKFFESPILNYARMRTSNFKKT